VDAEVEEAPLVTLYASHGGNLEAIFAELGDDPGKALKYPPKDAAEFAKKVRTHTLGAWGGVRVGRIWMAGGSASDLRGVRKGVNLRIPAVFRCGVYVFVCRSTSGATTHT
jgi:hypothetical protein